MPVPAVYYAHLASNRARAHESVPASEGPRGGQKYEEAQQDQAVARGQGMIAQDGSSQTGTSLPLEARPLLPLGNPDSQDGSVVRIRTSMCKLFPSPLSISTNEFQGTSKLLRHTLISTKLHLLIAYHISVNL